MRVLVLGAGVIGTSTAYFLSRSGAEVTVVDRQPAVAQETSFANAGQISPGYSTPWAAPGLPFKALRWLFERHAPLSIRPDGTLFQWQWMAALLAQCRADRYAVNKERMMRLAGYSRDVLRRLREEIGIAYEHRSRGTLQVFRTEAQVEAVQRDVEVLKACGVPFELLDGPDLARIEPGLARAAVPLAGGLRLPDDETGDCQLFTTGLAERAQALGARFLFGHRLIELCTEGGRVIGARVDDGTGERVLTADRVVLALGSCSREVAKSLGLKLPVYPVKGYSLTLPLQDDAMAPVSTVLDESFKVAVTRFDRRIRVGGMAELAGFNRDLRSSRRATLQKVVSELFPGAGDVAHARFWTGLRPMTPDGTPIVGPSGVEGLYLNTGHGTLGWTMACGSGKLVADLLLGRAPDIDPSGLTVSRYDARPAPRKVPAAAGLRRPPVPGFAPHG